MKIPLISIILPVYNGADRIKEAINSVISQSFTNWELLVIDDGSTDNTRGIVDNFSKNDQRIKYIRNENNLGIQKTLNKGLNEARGEYVARIDDDDSWIDQDKLKSQFEFLEKNKNYVLVGTGVIVQDENHRELFKYIPPIEDKEIRKKILLKNCFTHSSVLFRKGIALKFDGYSDKEDVKHIEDYDLWLKLGTAGKLANLETYSVIFMQRGGTISDQNRFSQAKRSLDVIKKFKNEYPNFLKGYFFTTARLLFFLIHKNISLNPKLLFHIKTIYKKF